jgi:hypothetical protein
LVADKSTSSIENKDELRRSTTHQKKHGFFSPFSSSILHKQQQHQYNARPWNEQKRESMDSSSSSSSSSNIINSSHATTTKCKEREMGTRESIFFLLIFTGNNYQQM